MVGTAKTGKEGDDVKVTMSYEALPEIPEVDFSGIELERMVAKAADADIDEAIASLAETAQDFKKRRKGSKAKDGDQIEMDFVGKVDGEAFEGARPKITRWFWGRTRSSPALKSSWSAAKEGRRG